MFQLSKKNRIDITSALILVVLTLAAGIAVYVVMQRQAESLLSKSLETSLRSNVRLFESQIDHALNNTKTVASRPNLINKMQLLVANPGNAGALNELTMIATSFLQTGFTGIAFYDAAGHELAIAGQFPKPDLSVDLQSNNLVALLWSGEFILRTRMDFLDQQGRRIGMVKTDTRLPVITEAYADLEAIGKTGEYAVCARLADDEKNMDCFLNRHSGKDFKRFARIVEGKSLPMDYALNGEAGIIFAKDYRREQVVAAYSAVSTFGLGIVMKIDQTELYQPVFEQLKFIAPLLALLVLVGILLLRILVKPLLQMLVDSERATRSANTLLRDSEKRSRAIVDNVDEGIVAITEDGVIDSFNPAAEQIFGYTGNDIKGQNVRLLLPEEQREKHDAILKYYLEARDQKFIGSGREAIGLRKNGTRFQMEINTSEARLESGNLFIVSVRDIELRKQAENRIRQLNHELAQFKNTLDQTLEGVFMFRPDTLRFTYVNLGAQRQLSYTESELMQMTPVDIMPEFTLTLLQKLLQSLMDGVQLSHTFQTIHRHKDGHDIPVEIFIQYIHMEGQDPRFVAMVTDISERRQAEQRITHLANHDALTNLPNRNLLQDRIQQALLYAQRNRVQGAVLFIDLDKFKSINDTLGHDVGDLLLITVAHRLVSSLRVQDTVARYGGDEFIVVLHSVSTIQDVGRLARKLLDALLLPYHFKEHELNISASIGIAVFPADGADADTLLTHSDTAMYIAKQAGRNNYKFFARQMNL